MLLLALRPDRLFAIVWWRLTGKKLRARHRLRDAIASLPFAYERRIEAEGQADLSKLKQNPRSPRFCVHVHYSDEMAETVQAAITSAECQSHALTHGIIVTKETVSSPTLVGGRMRVLEGRCRTVIEGLWLALSEAERLGADYCVPLRADVTLPRHAIAAYASDSLMEHANTASAVLFADQDEARLSSKSLSRGKNAWLKPEWDERMALSQDYISTACALPVSAALAALEQNKNILPSSLFELLLRMGRGSPHIPVRHVPRITARTKPEDWSSYGAQTVQAVQTVTADSASVAPGPFGTAIVRWRQPQTLPNVSIVIATRDKVDLLRTCVDGLLAKTDYPTFEIIIADNDSEEAETLAYLKKIRTDPRVQVVCWPHPFNYSAINNFAVTHASGEYLCLLNNDIEILHPDWLRVMLTEAMQPDVGAVGARLLYPDHSIQHAGVVIGMGNAAGHAHRSLPEGMPGYFGQAYITRGASAVTGACLLVKKSHFEAVDGLDEEDLAIAYNDIDFCLKLRRQGLTNIYASAATLIHHESKSRGMDLSPEHMERYLQELKVFQDRWNTKRIVDPWHHPLLDRTSEIYKARELSRPF